MKNSPSRLSEIIAVIKKYRLTKDITPENVRLALEELGPTFVKMGQILSSRDDLIPKEFCNEFQKLKHSVKPMPYETVEEILTREYDCPPSEIYQEINKIVDADYLMPITSQELVIDDLKITLLQTTRKKLI